MECVKLYTKRVDALRVEKQNANICKVIQWYPNVLHINYQSQ